MPIPTEITRRRPRKCIRSTCLRWSRPGHPTVVDTARNRHRHPKSYDTSQHSKIAPSPTQCKFAGTSFYVILRHQLVMLVAELAWKSRSCAEAPWTAATCRSFNAGHVGTMHQTVSNSLGKRDEFGKATLGARLVCRSLLYHPSNSLRRAVAS